MYNNKAGLLATGVWSSDTSVPIVDHNIFDYKFVIKILTINLSQSDINLIKILYLCEWLWNRISKIFQRQK